MPKSSRTRSAGVPWRSWQPPPAPERARQERGATPVSLTVIPTPGRGPEDVVIDAQGRAIVGLGDGRILRIDPERLDGRPDSREAIQTLARTDGRPLGIEITPEGELLVCDAHRGVLAVAPETGRVTSVVSRVDGEPMQFCNNASLGADGTIYFTDSSRYFGVDRWRGELLAHTGSGRLLRRRPDGTVDLLIDGLQFANGVALAPDESFVAVAETNSYRIRRLWLTGPREGSIEMLVENLPGFPDNLSIGTDGLLWVALPNARDRTLDAVLPHTPLLRKAVWAMPDSLQPQGRSTVWAQAYDLDGNLVHDLQTSDENLHMVTGVREVDGTVWLSSLTAAAVGVIRLGGR